MSQSPPSWPAEGDPSSPFQVEPLDVLQSDLDDESPQVLGALIDRLLAEGALDAHLTPLFMKKNRPATRIEVLCHPDARDRFIRLLLTETSTLGVKVRRVERYSLPRRMESITLDGHSIRIKIALLDGQPLRAQPEFEDCKRAAQALGLPLKTILERAKIAAAQLLLP